MLWTLQANFGDNQSKYQKAREALPKNRWGYEVINDLMMLKLKILMQLTNDRKAWNDLVQKTKTLVGLYCKKTKKKGELYLLDSYKVR